MLLKHGDIQTVEQLNWQSATILPERLTITTVSDLGV